MQIEVIQVRNDTKTNKNGGVYQQLEVAYKSLSDGKVGAKKLFSFKEKELFSTLAGAKSGDVFNITSEKVGNFWEWTNAVRGVPQAAGGVGTGGTGAFSKAPRSTYETPEERARRQVYIMKQSSVSTAATVLTAGAKAPPALSDVLKMAQDIYNWVSAEPKLEEMLDDIPFDIPEVQ